MSDFSRLTLHWYRQNKRDLPWRRTKNPYNVWLSEIILQQTRVDQGMSYYLKFCDHYPTVIDLANAEEIDILNDWQGLGYYSRARNLHYSAKLIRDKYDGKFPSTYAEVLKLKGVGKYTAAAISSFCFDEVKAVVDGNVYRVLSRVFDISTPIDSSAGIKEFQALADELIDPNNPGDFNQAIMELGATVCTPKANCDICPVQDMCLARHQNTIDTRPVKSKKLKVAKKYFHYMVYSQDGKTLIEKRSKKGIWQHLYQFPMIETEKKTSATFNESIQKQVKASTEIIHILSHQKIHAVFHHFDHFPDEIDKDWLTINHDEIENYPLPRIIDRYLEENGID